MYTVTFKSRTETLTDLYIATYNVLVAIRYAYCITVNDAAYGALKLAEDAHDRAAYALMDHSSDAFQAAHKCVRTAQAIAPRAVP